MRLIIYLMLLTKSLSEFSRKLENGSDKLNKLMNRFELFISNSDLSRVFLLFFLELLLNQQYFHYS
jgi:hypothetical protein